jgi:hypothetical protein
MAGSYVDDSAPSGSIISCVAQELSASQDLWSVGFVNK